MNDFQGIIIEESLADTEVLNDVIITNTKVEPITKEHATPWLQQWTLHTVIVPKNKADVVIEKISQSIDPEHSNSWYADFKNDSMHYIVFLNKVFKIDRSKPEQYQPAADYANSLSIPAHQVTFRPT